MQYHEAIFLGSAIQKAQFPQSELPEFIMVGRSNVGKSSLINTLVNRKKLAYVGNTPGKTKLLNFFAVDNQFVLVDAPGYGYAQRSKQELLNFAQMMDDYFGNRQQLKAMVQIVDMRHKPTKDDIEMIEYARSFNIKVLVVATKYDKVKASDRMKNLKVIKEALKINDQSLIAFSSETRYGLPQLWEAITKIIA
ncbi:MAG: ribosome biogenesis GTP-binding protein YihA/YsxC [Erysipelotrichaceae bacterium]|nr:ribosome biogenesis GTP-binding protein YihA/YsxC [Erysipelotrichaceae bacterium]MDY5252355.1 ribosome biogenesis GTP-binding protein YihA/YsxC [Erysipelotrichaceae bacterium]